MPTYHSIFNVLVSSGKFLYGRDILAQKYSQLTSVFDQLELCNLTTTYNGNEGWVFLLCHLYEDIPLFFILYLKLYIMVWEMASASFEQPFSFKSIPSWRKFINCTNSIGTESSWLWRSTFNDEECSWDFQCIAFLTSPVTLTRL